MFHEMSLAKLFFFLDKFCFFLHKKIEKIVEFFFPWCKFEWCFQKNWKKIFISQNWGKKNPCLVTVKIRNVPWNELSNNVLFFFLKIFIIFFTKKLGNFWNCFLGHSTNSNKVLENLAKKCIAQNWGKKKILLSNS